MMASIWEKAISILSGNLNSGRSYLITAVQIFKRPLLVLVIVERESIYDFDWISSFQDILFLGYSIIH